MAYTSWSFVASQTAGEESSVTLTSVTAGTDVLVTGRRVYFIMDDGTFLVEEGVTTEYNVWALATNPITLDVLGTSDKACRVVVEWVDANGGVLYDSTQYLGFTLFNETEDYSQTQLMAANPLLVNDNNFWKNKQLLRTLIDSGNNAIEFASDLYNAQLCYDAATEIRNNSQYLFNGNS